MSENETEDNREFLPSQMTVQNTSSGHRHKKNKDLIDDDVQKCIGAMGKYQLFIVLLLFPCKITTAFHPLGIVFLAPPVQYLCLDDANNGTSGELNTCPCTVPQYDRSLFQDTITITWDLICEREWLVSFNQTVFMLGMLVGSLVFGSISDRFGRKSIIIPILLEMSAGVTASFVTKYWAFIIARFFVGSGIGGTMIISFVLLVEFTGKKYRELASCLIQIPFNTGYLLLPVVGYFIRSWRWVQFTFSVTPIIMLVTFWYLPESPRWLLATGKTERAIQVITRAAKINNRPTEDIERIIKRFQENKPQVVVKKGTILDLFRTKNLRKNIICMSVNWIVCSFGFFGLSQYIGQLDGDIFTNIAISAGLNLFATFAAYVCIKSLARKPALCTMHIGTSICMFAIAVIPKEVAIAKVVLACIGNVGMFIVFVIVYLYTSELFPTVVRNAAVGMASMSARVGSMVAPFVIPLSVTAAWLPPVIFGSAPIIATVLCLMLPETKGCDLPTTIADGEAFGMKEKRKQTT